MYADGYNNTNRNVVALQLHKKDRYILKDLNSLLQPKKPLQFIKREGIYKKFAHDAYRLVISNKHISQKLVEHGCMNKKTFKIRFPNFLKDGVVNHFIRGYFDGDGSICYKPKGKSLFSIIGNEFFIKSIQSILAEKCNLKMTKLEIDKENNNIFTVRYCGGQQIKRIRDYLYSEATIFLKRKFNRFEKINNEYS